MTTLSLVYLPPTSLRLDKRNPKAPTPKTRQALARSISRFGFVLPVLARAEDRLVIGGHERLRAALRDKLEEVPVLLLEGLSDDEALALNVALNNERMMGVWDTEQLRAVLQSVLSVDRDAMEAAGFTEEQAAVLFGTVASASPAESESKARDKTETLANVLVRVGDDTVLIRRDVFDARMAELRRTGDGTDDMLTRQLLTMLGFKSEEVSVL